jgi:xanthine dehydrogenase small subunit
MATAAPARQLQFTLNGETVSLDGVAPHTTLLDFIRSRGLTGAKEGCAEGECGACAVALVAEHGSATAYHVVNSCLMPAALAADHEISTVESLANGDALAPAQQAMADGGGSQCGYCTPGFVMSLFAEQYRPDRQGPCDPLSMSGNLCRCTGYRPIRDAAHSLGAPPEGAHRARLDRPAPRLGSIDAPGLSRPSTLAECVEILAHHADATLIAGSTDLGVEANLRAKRWPHLVSLEGIDELRQFSESTDAVTIGAALPLSEIGRRWGGAPAVIHEWLELFASPCIRNRATLGGNLATASPIGDSAPLLLALDATVHMAGPEGARSRALSSFFLGYRRTALRPREIITAVAIPKPLPALVRFYKIAKRRLDDISTVAAGIAIDTDRDAVVTRARFAFGGVAATPIRVAEAEAAAVGQKWSEAAVEHVQAVLAGTLSPLGDHRGSKEYRQQVSERLIEKFWWETRA